ncbi:phosphatidylinositol N-acetylglucosaminyltransferase GPI3 subunit [Neoconidiobolus thromboides FSU 785]|nr:phosphatidylinositol N-acetylglucosaminyltransferase GPI3 subunit [Neoconidiobolus thromboides FSU 785]
MKLNICFVSDFFFPNVGGVESHLYHLAQQLIEKGHKVIVITHNYNERVGIRYLPNGLKVYYIPHFVIYNQATFPNLFLFFPLFRNIVIREKISIVHGHQAFSCMALEAIFHARTMGLKACFTDHSLFGFADTSSIGMNKFLKFNLSDIDHVICVSHTCRENTVLRANLDPDIVSVIPNAIVPSNFLPDPKQADPKFITIVVLSRLVYRKGIDLLVAIIPRICQKYSNVKFLIGGDGPKRVDLEQMREKHLITDRVELLGKIKKEDVRSVLVKGNIFLNTSLTEAFCIAVVEAASCGLMVVSTKVGGIPEVLPRDMLHFGMPEEKDMIKTVSEAIEKIQTSPIDPFKMHRKVMKMYSWADVCDRTERIYFKIIKSQHPPLLNRLKKYYGCGPFSGILFCIFAAIDFLILLLLEYFSPKDEIEICPNFNLEKYKQMSMDFSLNLHLKMNQ